MTGQIIHLGPDLIHFVTDTLVSRITTDDIIRDQEVRKYWHEPVLNVLLCCYGNGTFFSDFSAGMQSDPYACSSVDVLLDSIEKHIPIVTQTYLKTRPKLEPDVQMTALGFTKDGPFATRWKSANGVWQPRVDIAQGYDFLPRPPRKKPQGKHREHLMISALHDMKTDWEDDGHPHIGGRILSVKLRHGSFELKQLRFR